MIFFYEIFYSHQWYHGHVIYIYNVYSCVYSEGKPLYTISMSP